LSRLPEKYRAPLVLHYLEGKPVADVARELGWPYGTVLSLLARGRDRLRGRLMRGRLTRRGVTLTAAGLAAALAQPAGAGALSATLAQSTVKVTALLVLGQAAIPGSVAPKAAALAKGVLHAMFVTKVKVATVAVMAASLLGLGAAGLGHRILAGKAVVEEQTDVPRPAAASAKPQAAAADAKVAVRGRVLTPDGKGAVGAKLFLTAYNVVSELGATDGDGRFTVEVSRLGTPPRKLAGWLAALSPRFGVDFLELNDRTPEKDVELRLPADCPIRGRVINLEGKPAAGATVRLNVVSVYGADTVEPFLAGWLKRPNFRSPWPAPTKVLNFASGDPTLLSALTDKDGRFELTGAGAERRVNLRINGPGIAQTYANVITRTGFDPEPYNAATRALRPKDADEQEAWTYVNPMHLGPEPTVVAETEKPIRGTVIDAGTGKPRAGVRVRMDQGAVMHATTDKGGGTRCAAPPRPRITRSPWHLTRRPGWSSGA
jgi:hypothetical protein